MKYETDLARTKRYVMFEVLEERAGMSELLATFQYPTDAFGYALHTQRYGMQIYLRRSHDKSVLRDLDTKTLREVQVWADTPAPVS